MHRLRLFIVVHSMRTKDSGHKLKYKNCFTLGTRRKKIQHEDSQELEQIPQRGCVVSILGGFQDSTRKSPEQPGPTS